MHIWAAVSACADATDRPEAVAARGNPQDRAKTGGSGRGAGWGMGRGKEERKLLSTGRGSAEGKRVFERTETDGGTWKGGYLLSPS